MTSERREQAGFTLIELMISLVIFSFVVAGVLSVAVSITQGLREQRGAITTEEAVRVPLDFIADALRQASPGVPDPTKMFDAATCDDGAIEVTNYSNQPDELELVYASGSVVTSTRGVLDDSTSTVTVTDATQLQKGDYVVVTDTATGHIMKVTDVTGTTITVAGGCGTYSYAAGSLVVRAQRAKFTIEVLDGIPTLMMDPDANGPELAEPLAEGIEDMQIAVAVDADSANGIAELGAGANDDEWHYNAPLDNAPIGVIRAVRITLIARSNIALPGGPLFTRPAAEDRSAGAGDYYRRRVLRSIVEVRNAGGSP